tara:strand:+ start:219 stop:434 length:216 start_codon:yes stop_codon:yes gene_type:complete
MINEIKQLIKTESKENKILFILQSHPDLIYLKYDDKKYKRLHKILLKSFKARSIKEINIDFEFYLNKNYIN